MAGSCRVTYGTRIDPILNRRLGQTCWKTPYNRRNLIVIHVNAKPAYVGFSGMMVWHGHRFHLCLDYGFFSARLPSLRYFFAATVWLI